MKKLYVFISAAIIAGPIGLKAQTVTKIAGVVSQYPSIGKIQSNSGTTNNISTANFYGPSNLAVDKNGRAWIVEALGNRLRTIDNIAAPTTVLSRIGNLFGNAGGTDASGATGLFNTPYGVVIDSAGNIYVADMGNNCIRKITPYVNQSNAQTVTTFAGTNSNTGGYNNGTGTAALFNSPTDLAIDSLQNIYVADMGNHCIRKITPAGVVTTLTGSLNPGNWNGTGSLAAFASPTGLGWYTKNELLIADPINANIRRVNVLTGVVTNVGGIKDNLGMAVTGNTDGDTSVATFNMPSDVTTDSSKNIYVVDGLLGGQGSSNLIRKITGSCVSTFAGSAGVTDTTNGIGAAARFNAPTGITFYNGALYVADQGNNTIRKITVLGTPPDAFPIAYFASKVRVGYDTSAFTLIDSSQTVTNSRVWGFYPKDVTYISGDSTSAQPKVKFAPKGFYTISLTVKNCWGTNTLTRTNYINIFHVGINEVKANDLVSVYPNPSNGKFEIALNNTHSGLTIRVMDINGKMVVEQKVSAAREIIDMTGFAKGIYILNISGNDTSVNQKLVIQ